MGTTTKEATATGLLSRALQRVKPAKSASPSEVKASRTGPLVAIQMMGRPVWSGRDYISFAHEGFERNPVVHRCVRVIAEAAASVPWVLHEGRQELDAHPLLDVLTRPNPAQGGGDLLENWYGHLLVAGNAYLEVVEISGAPKELHVLRPDRMKVVPGMQGWPARYEYTVAGRTISFDQTDAPAILHMRMFHPTDDHYGLSPMEAAAYAVDIHNAAAGWNKALIDNSARPSGALVYQGADGNRFLSEEQFERLKGELENNHQGGGNAGRPLLLEGGLDWKQMSLSPKEMDFAEARNGAARDIALAFGVPPMLLGIPGDNTYANYREANVALWRQTVLPLVARASRALGNWLAPRYEGRLKLSYNLDNIPALNAERDALWDRLNQASFLDDAEKRQAVGYGERQGGE